MMYAAAAAVSLLALGYLIASGSKEEEEVAVDEVEDLDSEKQPTGKVEKVTEVAVDDAEEEETVKPTSAAGRSSSGSATGGSAGAEAVAHAVPKKAAVPVATPVVEAAATMAVDTEAERETLKQEFHDVTRKGTKLMKAQSYERAAVQFGRAIEIAEALAMPQASVETLYNNRAAMYEKAQLLDAALEDCTVVLAMNTGHVKVRKRRARIYSSQGRPQDALVEYCAVLITETMEIKRLLEPYKDYPPAVQQQQQQKVFSEKGAGQQEVQEKLQELMAVCGKEKAAKVLAAREAAGGLPPPSEGVITSESSIFQLLLSYTEYVDEVEPLFAGAADDVEELSQAVKAANASGDLMAKLRSLKARGQCHMVARRYSLASADLLALWAAFDAACPEQGDGGEGGGGGGGGGGVPQLPPPPGVDPVEAASCLRWAALFHHVRYDLEGALKVYRRAAALLQPAGSGGAPLDTTALARVEVMRSGVYVDKGDLQAAAAALERADALSSGSKASSKKQTKEAQQQRVDVLMHRSQLHLLSPDGAEQSEADLRACLDLKPNHVVALLRLAMILMSVVQQLAGAAQQTQNQALMDAAGEKLKEAEAAVAKAKRIRPGMSEVFQVTGSIEELKGDLEAAMKAHDEAIKLDPKNPTPYINKAVLLQNMMAVQPPTSQEQVVASGQAQMGLLEQAIAADPLCSQAHKQLAEIKLKFATKFSETEKIVADLEGAIGQCRDPTELEELCTFKSIATAQLEAAQDLGMTSFADIQG